MSTVEIGTITTVYDTAVVIRDVAAAVLSATTDGAPDLQYITPTEPVFDCCPALIVWGETLSEADTNPLTPPLAIGQRVSFGRVNKMLYHVYVLRCSPRAPKTGVDVDSQETVSSQVLQDGWAMWTGFYNAIKDGTFMSYCDEVFFDHGDSIRDMGGCVGWEFQLQATLPGIR